MNIDGGTFETERMDIGREAPELSRALVALERAIRIDPTLRELVKLRASILNGCAYCIDMHTKDARKAGESEQRLYAAAAWHEAPFFSERERAALRWAELINAIPHADPSDAEFAALRAQLSDTEIAELGFAISVICAWNLINVGLRNPMPEKVPAAG